MKGNRVPASEWGHAAGFRIGQCYLGLNRPSQAIDWWQKFIKESPTGPWRGQAQVAIVDLALQSELNLKKAAEHATAAADSLAKRLDNSAGEKGPAPSRGVSKGRPASPAPAADPSWKEAAYDIHLRQGIVSLIASRFDVAAEAFQQAKQSAPSGTSHETQVGLDRLIESSKRRVKVIPDELGVGDDRAAIALALGNIYSILRQYDVAKGYFSLPLGGQWRSRSAAHSLVCRPGPRPHFRCDRRRAFSERCPSGRCCPEEGRGESSGGSRFAASAGCRSLRSQPQGISQRFMARPDAPGIGTAHRADCRRTVSGGSFPAGQSPSEQSFQQGRRQEGRRAPTDDRCGQAGAEEGRHRRPNQGTPVLDGPAASLPDEPLCPPGPVSFGPALCRRRKARWGVGGLRGTVHEVSRQPLDRRRPSVADRREVGATIRPPRRHALAQAAVDWYEHIDKAKAAQSQKDSSGEQSDDLHSLKEVGYDIYVRAGLVEYLSDHNDRAVAFFEKAKPLQPERTFVVAHGKIPTGIERLIEAAKSGKSLTPEIVRQGDEKAKLI